jgi:acyl-CoA dehydrogenase
MDEADLTMVLRADAARMGLFGFAIPEEYGGLGLTMAQEARLVMELGYTTPAFRSMFGTNNGIAGHVLLEGGTPEQKKEYLPRLASGEWTASFALTEEQAGSDPSGLATSVAARGDRYVINGSKRYITNAPVADVFMVFARHADGPAQGKISALLVPAGTPGLLVGPKDEKMGQHGAWTSDVRFEDVEVPAAALIGTPARAMSPRCAAWPTGACTSPRCASGSPSARSTRRSATPSTASRAATRSPSTSSSRASSPTRRRT